MNRIPLAAGLLCALGLGAGVALANADALSTVREKGVLRVAVYKDFPPYSYTDANGRMTGLDVEVGRALAERMGVAMSLEPIPASDESMEDDLRNAVWKGHYMGWGAADVMLHVPVNADFQQRVDKVTLFAPYYRELVAIAYDKDKIPDLNSLDVFRKEKVGVEMRTVADQYLITTESGAYINNVRHFRTPDAACAALKSGEVPALAAQRGQLEYCLGGDRARFVVTTVPAPNVRVFEWNVGMAVRASEPGLRDALGDAMESLRQDGTLQKIFDANHVSLNAPAH
ncbi:substrate-binding periplasmic protein [Plasticicumulans acidivorans]|uniref:Amino acid ABC transporter substrate-binding protein (PAAT family) n=1 Tax=Plasticicumulans acidivorans TaxID=886464 RepID=A0A317MT80_9GAMM|nr:transporter substrate-binding domain-containing protein [Plasticicumulans acidivorans]PWV60627.1 amino acid ABC transporter substrate-binding protein (PAAT family) [Plasticicumulans acidivorans]